MDNQFYLSQFRAAGVINPPKRVMIFDTSLRDGEQTPGLTYTIDEKLEIARRLDELGVSKIEAGFAITSEGEAQAIQSVNEAAEKYFVGNAQILRKIEMVEKALEHNAKIVVPSNTELVNVIGDMAGILPLKKEEK